MNSSRFKKFGGVLAVLALLIIACFMAAPAYADNGTVVSIPDANATYCNTTTVAISVTNVTELGALTIRLHYTPGVVHVTNVAEGNLGGTFLSAIDNVTGVTNMTWFTTTGMNGTFTFANVTLHAVGSPGDTSPLNLEVITLADTSGSPISYTEDDGTFTIPAPTPTPAAPSGVGGTPYPPNKLAIFAPWIALAAAIIAGTTIFLRRRRAQS